MSHAGRLALAYELYAPIIATTCEHCGHTTYERKEGAGVIDKETYVRLINSGEAAAGEFVSLLPAEAVVAFEKGIGGVPPKT